MPLLTLLTDFGLSDYYVGAVKGTLLRLAPGTQLVDLSHDVPAGDVEEGAWLLAAAVRTFPAGTVHLAVVDPGVGSDRRMLAAAADGQLFVAPDNGLLTPFLDRAEARWIDRPDLYLAAAGNTFHGRDRLAPVAAALLRGTALAALGPLASEPVRLPHVPPLRGPQELVGRVVHVDRFGNLVTDLPADWLPPDLAIEAAIGAHRARRYADHYAVLPPGEPAVLPGSTGTIELACNGESLAALWRVGRGAEVRVLLHPRG
jgi:S-adenosylmethionine hydrolase